MHDAIFLETLSINKHLREGRLLQTFVYMCMHAFVLFSDVYIYLFNFSLLKIRQYNVVLTSCSILMMIF